jgi:hypothetical protein
MRYFIFFFSHTNGSSFGFGNIAFSCEGFPSRDDVTAELTKDGRFHESIVITGFNEINKADYDAWIQPAVVVTT